MAPLFRAIAFASALTAACSSPSPVPTGQGATLPPADVEVEAVLTGLEIPWEIAFSPDGRVLVTERPGRLRIYDSEFQPIAQQAIPVRHAGEGGLLGMALHPQFNANRWVYLYMTVQEEGTTTNRVVRYLEEGNTLVEDRVIFHGLPGSTVHDGGRIAFGPDDMLYVTAGDAGHKDLAQDLSSPAGKIHRLNEDGSPPADNPFAGSTVYSLGHRNPQGLAWDAQGRLYAAEHGPSGFDGPGGYDEVNWIVPGGNYGWPRYGRVGEPGLADPVLLSVEPIAPSGCLVYTGSLLREWRGRLLVATLRGQHLRRAVIDPADPSRVSDEEALFEGQFGRLRTVVQGPDGAIYLLTSNRDGRATRGFPLAEDDRILRLRPAGSP